MTCTCTIEYDDGDPKDGGGAFIHHCPLCKAAGALLEAATQLHRHFTFREHFCSHCEQEFPTHKETCRFAPLAAAIAAATEGAG